VSSAPKPFVDFEILIEQRELGGYHLRATCRLWETTVKADFAAESLIADFERVRPHLTEQGRDVRLSLVVDLETFGKRLFATVFGPALQICWGRCLDQAHQAGKGLRLKLLLTDAPALAVLPWEYLYDSMQRQFVGLLPDVAIVRYPETPKHLDAAVVEEPLRILVVMASPADQHRLDLEQERRRIEEAFADLVRTRRVALEVLSHATWPSLRRRLTEPTGQELPCHVLHFIGHGGFDGERQTGVLLFESETGSSELVAGWMLEDVVRRHQSLRVLVLNSCYGAAGSAQDAFSGLAQGLTYHSIQAVVAMQLRISDMAAIEFSRWFYGALATGAPVDAAVAEARGRLRDGFQLEWGMPVLFLRSADGDLFKLEARRPPPPETPASRLWLILAAVLVVVLLGAGALAVWRYERQTAQPAPPAGSAQPTRTAPTSSPECRLPQSIDRLGMRFRRIGPGTFLMGTQLTTLDDIHRYLDEGMVHEVTLSPYCLQATEVTQAQWSAVMGGHNPSHNPGADRPVDSVSWIDANRFIDALDDLAHAKLFRLPTEAEWEFAARAGSQGRYSFGDDPGKLDEYGNCRGHGRQDRWRTLAVASLAPNPWGLFDMYGNVEEWVEDLYNFYSPLAVRDPHNNPSLPLSMSFGDRVLRGGSWDNEAARCRSANRDHAQAAYVNERVGFRLVRILENP